MGIAVLLAEDGAARGGQCQRPEAFCRLQRRQCRIAGAARKGVQTALEPHEHAHGAVQHLAHDAQPVGVGFLDLLQQFAVQLGAVRILKHGEGGGTARALSDACEYAELIADVLEVRDHLEHAVRIVLERDSQRQQLLARGLVHGGEVSRPGAVGHGARGGQAHGAGGEALPYQFLHGFDVFGAGLLAPYGTLAHGMDA